MSTPAELPTDGRVQRSERSRAAIVRAMLELIGAGTLSPTAQQVADHADVGVRTVFRHFSDMDSLFAAMNERLEHEVAPLFVDCAQTGPLDARLEALVENRLTIFEKLSPYLRSSTLQRGRSTFLSQQHDRNVRMLRRDLRRWLPELDEAPRETAEALELLLSFESILRLRTDQRLGLRRASGVLLTTARALAGATLTTD